MYLDYYGLKKQPFSISPDPDFIWFSQKHTEAFSTLKYGILENKGFLVLTGDIGTGKTLLIKNLEKNISIPTIIVTVPDPDMKTLEFYNYLAEEIQMNKKFRTKGDFLIHFKNFLHQAYGTHKKVLLILDEAQRLNYKLLEEIRLLSNLEMTNRKLLNIFFVGQNEFDEMLKDEKSKSVRQRIIVGYHLDPFNEEETSLYISHRLKVAGTEKQIFSFDAIKEIFTFSAGYPRLINILCDNALLYGWSADLQVLNADVIKGRAKELQIEKKPIHKEKDEQIIDKNIPEIEETIKREPIIEETIKPETKSEEVKEYESKIIEEITDQSILEDQKKNDKSNLFKNNNIRKREIEETKAIILRETPEDKPSRKPLELFKYAAVAALMLVLGSLVFFYYDSNIKSDLHWSIEEVAPKQKFFISENKNDSIEIEQIIKAEDAKNTPTENNLLNKVDEIKSSRPKRDLLAKSADELNQKKTDKTFQKEELISEPDFKKFTVKEESYALSSVKKYNKSDMVTSLSNGTFLENDTIVIYFTYNSFDLSENALAILEQIVRVATEHIDTEISVEGYTDSFGNYWYNQKLSQLRADTVKNYFVEQGLSASRIKAEGKGQGWPMGNNETADGRGRNRRVEINFKLADN